jgi:hypothetical protein
MYSRKSFALKKDALAVHNIKLHKLVSSVNFELPRSALPSKNELSMHVAKSQINEERVPVQ